MTHLFGGVFTVARGLLQIVTFPVRMLAAPFGCVISMLFSGLLLLGILFAIFYFVGLRQPGPTIENDFVTVEGSGGVFRSYFVSDEAATLFDVKVAISSNTEGQAVAEVVLEEREINSKLWALLRAERELDPGFPVESIVVVLTPGRATFFVAGDAIGRDVGIEVRARFTIDDDGHLDLDVGRVRLGSLPSIPFSKQLADLVLESTPLDDQFEQALPDNVLAVRIEEARLVIEIDLQGS